MLNPVAVDYHLFRTRQFQLASAMRAVKAVGLRKWSFPYRKLFGRSTLVSSMVIIVLVGCLELIGVSGQQKGDEVCETLPSEIHLIKGMAGSFTHLHEI